MEKAAVPGRRPGDVDDFLLEGLQGSAFIELHQDPFTQVILEQHLQGIVRLRGVAAALGLVMVAQQHPAGFHAGKVERLEIDHILPIGLTVEIEGIIAAGGIVGAVVHIGIDVDPDARIRFTGLGEFIEQRQRQWSTQR